MTKILSDVVIIAIFEQLGATVSSADNCTDAWKLVDVAIATLPATSTIAQFQEALFTSDPKVFENQADTQHVGFVALLNVFGQGRSQSAEKRTLYHFQQRDLSYVKCICRKAYNHRKQA